MDQLTQMTVFTATGAIMGHWLLGMSTLVTTLLLYLLSYVRSASPRGGARVFGWLPRELVGQAGIALGLTLFDFIYFIFRNMRFLDGLVSNDQSNVTLAMYYIDATNWRFVGSVVAWICKTAFADCVMLLRAVKLFRNNDRLGGVYGYYGVVALLSILYSGTLAAGIVTWVGLLRPQAATFDDLLEQSATFFMSIHCGYNALVTLLISFVYWRAMSHEFKMMTVAQLALRSFSAGNMLYTLLITVLVVLYQRQLLFVYFWYDITQPLMTMSFTIPMLLTAAARILPIASSMKSTNMNAIRALSNGVSVPVRRNNTNTSDAEDSLTNLSADTIQMDALGSVSGEEKSVVLGSVDDFLGGGGR